MENYKTREEWLEAAVEKINTNIFDGDLPIEEYQVGAGWCKSKKAMAETIMPITDDEDVSMDDFYPVSIYVSHTVKDPVEIVGSLVHECIHAFMGIKGHGKAFKKEAKKIGFLEPITEYHPSDDLVSMCEVIVKELGEYPGKPIILKTSTKETKPQRGKLFCPTCGFECKTTTKMLKEYSFPTCSCGTQMGEDLDGFEDNDIEEITKSYK